ncbi:MAG: ATP-binding cassette domain-containing protein, partial [Bosea sp. (in: a-proteobacteria)]
MSYFVDVQHVTHVYGGGDGLPAVEDLTVRVRQGEFAAIVGPSGCGKSTMMKLATGLQRPKTGTVEVDGREVTEPVKITGMAFQNP